MRQAIKKGKYLYEPIPWLKSELERLLVSISDLRSSVISKDPGLFKDWNCFLQSCAPFKHPKSNPNGTISVIL